MLVITVLKSILLVFLFGTIQTLFKPTASPIVSGSVHSLQWHTCHVIRNHQTQITINLSSLNFIVIICTLLLLMRPSLNKLINVNSPTNFLHV